MPITPSFHDDYSEHESVRQGSNRAFGLVFAGALCVLAGLRVWRGHSVELGWFVAAAVFAGLALLWPRALGPLNHVWFRFGLLLGRVVHPLVMWALFFGMVTPTALLMRLLGKAPLALGPDRGRSSYWAPRQPPGPAPDSVKHQF